MRSNGWPSLATIVFAFTAVCLAPLATLAADFPAPKAAVWVAKELKLQTGDTLTDVTLAYTTVGEPTGEPVLILHGTAGNAGTMLGPAFAGELFGEGQPLDAKKYFVIIPDALGTGKSTKPSDGMKGKFPRYTYDDMVDAQYRLVTEGLGIKHLRLVLGNSMGGMHAWTWGTRYPDMMDAIVPMASQPTEMSGRNWMMRRLIIDAIRNDPAYQDGNYTTQPKAMQIANVFYGLGTNGGNQGLQKLAPTRAAADKLLNERLAAPFTADANDFLYQWDSSRDYNPAPNLEKIKAAVLAINSADDERNPPELNVMERELKRIKNARMFLVPGSPDTAGHGTTAQAKHWKAELAKLLAETPKGGM